MKKNTLQVLFFLTCTSLFTHCSAMESFDDKEKGKEDKIHDLKIKIDNIHIADTRYEIYSFGLENIANVSIELPIGDLFAIKKVSDNPTDTIQQQIIDLVIEHKLNEPITDTIPDTIPATIQNLGFQNLFRHPCSSDAERQFDTAFNNISPVEIEDFKGKNKIKTALIDLNNGVTYSTYPLITVAIYTIISRLLTKQGIALSSPRDQEEALAKLQAYKIVFIYDTQGKKLIITSMKKGEQRRDILGGLEMLLDIVQKIDTTLLSNRLNGGQAVLPGEVPEWRKKVRSYIIQPLVVLLGLAIIGIELFSTFKADPCNNSTATNSSLL